MKVSVIIPFWNQKYEFVLAAIESVMAQHMFVVGRDTEIILVDDGSDTITEDYKKIAEYLETKVDLPGIKAVSHSTNRGTAAALNTGIEAACGEYIKWLSSDDVLYPDYLQRMFYHIDRLTDLEREETAIYFSDYHVISKNGAVIDVWKEPHWNAKTYWDRKKYLWMSFYGNGSSSLIPRKVFDKAGMFDESLRHSEDYEFWLRVAMVHDYDLYHVPEFLLQYRSHEGQLSKQPKIYGSLDHEIRSGILRRMSTHQVYELYRRHDRENP